ncbi:hypothetical protein [Agromyces neolithicus]|uniref:Lipoprotein with Yx(FWY)xxD motif n=1 Tax=Agromyces neolithicus TaxID=269420 RepID=A0ABN2M502_9MICO
MDEISKSNTTSTQTGRSGNRRRKYLFAGGAAVTALVLGIGGAFLFTNRDTPVVDSGAARVDVDAFEGAGEILVDGQGRALYIFEPDEAAEVTCTGGCADKWPPLATVGDAEPEVGEGVEASMISTVTAQDGARVLTFDGWPLYRYTSDQAGEVSGSGKDQNGGVWWALTPTGERVETD